MNILQVFNSRIQKHGSFEDFMIALARKAEAENRELGFVFPAAETQEVKEALESLGARIYIIADDWGSLGFIRELLKIIFKEKPDFLDFHFCCSPNLVPLFLILRLLRIKVIYHYHGEIIPVNELRFVNRHFSKLRLITLLVNKIICVSKANKEFLNALNIKRNVYVIYNGIDIDAFTRMAIERDFRKEMGFANGELIITTIASLIPRKGMNILIRAAQYALLQIPQARFVIIGAGDRERYQNLIDDLGIKNKVILTGLIKDYPYYILKASDLYVSASFAESFGLSIAEAQFLGIPVVATRVGGVPEVVCEGKTGFLTEAGNSINLSDQIVKLLKDNCLRREFSLAAREWVSKRFALKDKVDELFRHFS